MHYLPVEWDTLPHPLQGPRSVTVEVEGMQELEDGKHCCKP